MQNRSFLGSIPPVTLNLIIVNFIVWLAALTLPKIAGINLNYWLGLHYFAADDFNVVQLITYMFLHDTSGIEHIFFNMFSVSCSVELSKPYGEGNVFYSTTLPQEWERHWCKKRHGTSNYVQPYRKP